jgi:hypothetical protein
MPPDPAQHNAAPSPATKPSTSDEPGFEAAARVAPWWARSSRRASGWSGSPRVEMALRLGSAPVRPTEVLDAADAADRLTAAAAEGSIGPLASRPLVLIALDGTDTEPLEAIATVLPVVVVGVGRPQDGAPDLDVLLTDEPDAPAPWVSTRPGDLDTLVAAVDQSPLAAVTLVQLLRMGRTLAVPQRFVAESIAYGLLQSGPQYQSWLRARQDRQGRGEPDRDTDPAVLVER